MRKKLPQRSFPKRLWLFGKTCIGKIVAVTSGSKATRKKYATMINNEHFFFKGGKLTKYRVGGKWKKIFFGSETITFQINNVKLAHNRVMKNYPASDAGVREKDAQFWRNAFLFDLENVKVLQLFFFLLFNWISFCEFSIFEFHSLFLCAKRKKQSFARLCIYANESKTL